MRRVARRQATRRANGLHVQILVNPPNGITFPNVMRFRMYSAEAESPSSSLQERPAKQLSTS